MSSVEPDARAAVGGQPTGQLGPPAFEEGQPGLRGEMSGEGEPETEAPGVVVSDRFIRIEKLFERTTTVLGYGVDLA